MKKFLTVLLALSVVFTYTVGSAFAAVPADPKDKLSYDTMLNEIKDAYKDAQNDLLKAKNDALFDVFGKASVKEDKGGSYSVSKAAVEAVYDETYYEAALKQAKAEYEAKLEKLQAGAKDGADYFYVDAADTGLQPDGTQKAYPIDLSFSLKTGSANTAVLADKAAYAGLFKLDNSLGSGFGGTAKNDVAVKDAEIAKDAAITAIRAINVDAYSKEYNGAAKSNYDLAVDLKTVAIEEITKLVANNWADVYSPTTGILDQIEAIYTAPVNQKPAGGKLYTGGLLAAPYNLIGLDNLPTIADAPTAEAKLEWAKSKVLAGFTADINTRLNAAIDAADKTILDETLKGAKGDAAKIAAAKTAKEDAKAEAAAALEIATYLVENTTKLSDLISENKTVFSQSTIKYGYGQPWYYAPVDKSPAKNGDLYADAYNVHYDSKTQLKIVAKVADLKQEAKDKQASVLIDGAEYVAIEKALEKAIDDCYTKGNTNVTLEIGDATQNLWDRMDELAFSPNQVKVNDRKYNSVDKWVGELKANDPSAVYEEKFFDQVRTVVDETIGAIYSAKTVAEADAAFLAGLEKFEAIPTIADRNSVKLTKEYADLLAQYKKDIAAYVTYKDASITNAGLASKYAWKPSTLTAALQAELETAYTVEELKTKFTEAKATVDGLKTEAELEDAKKALDTRVAAVDPAKVTVADKETIGALRADLEDHNDYCDLIGNIAQKVVIKSSILNAYDKIKAAEEAAIIDAIKAIGTVTVDDKAAIEAVREQLDAYVAYYAGENASDATIKTLEGINYRGTTVADLEDDLDKAEIRAFKVMVGKLPADGSDVAGIKAAREFYEGLSLSAKSVVYRSSEYDKLVDLEKLVIRHVEGLKIVASSKAVKGKITVKWKVKGDASAADGFQVYKSKKAQKDYKFMGKTKKLSMVNKKGLKKGTRYFYKVRAYKVVDGKKIYSDWSNKANRIAK